jgi:hypothetical protein
VKNARDQLSDLPADPTKTPEIFRAQSADFLRGYSGMGLDRGVKQVSRDTATIYTTSGC